LQLNLHANSDVKLYRQEYTGAIKAGKRIVKWKTSLVQNKQRVWRLSIDLTLYMMQLERCKRITLFSMTQAKRFDDHLALRIEDERHDKPASHQPQ
jgi:hypothetical protein